MVDEQLLGRGRTAEIYAHGERRVAKLLLPGFDAEMLALEGRKTQAAHDAGAPAPATHGAVTVAGRPGYLFDRVDGPVMLDELRARLWRYRHHADLLARVHADVHARSTDALPDVKEKLAAQIDQAADIGPTTRRRAKDRLRELDDGDRVLHGDLHPGNIVLTRDGPAVIDWMDAARGDPAADVARTLWLLSPPVLGPEAGRIQGGFLTVFRRRYLRGYLAATGSAAADIHPWRLPVLAARLAEGIEYETAALLSGIEELTSD
ncbi:MAG TPA: phosphotransferase [Acidimicrobiia bacterium]